MARTTDIATAVQIEGFDQLQPIGRGGYSYVFSARQRDFNRRVALKVMTFGLVDERERRGFERECRAMGLVSQHPNIVTVFNSAFTRGEQPVIVMELYSGGTLQDKLKSSGPLPVAKVLDVGVKIAGALETAHQRGLLHRDIKPQNLFISEFGEPALGDFGISTVDEEVSISAGGGLTVHYAPPEVLEGAPASTASDIYSLGATLFTLLEGSRPFSSTTTKRQLVGELARRIMLEPPPRPTRKDVPRSLSELISRAMSKLASDRPQSAAELGRAFQRIQGELGLSITSLPIAAGDGLPLPAPTAAARVAEAPPSLAELFPPVGTPERQPVAHPDRARPAPVPLPVPGAPEVRIRILDDDLDESNTVTIGQMRSFAPAQPAPQAAPVSAKRVILGTLAAVVALAMVGFVLWFAGRDGNANETGAPTTTTIAGVPINPGNVPVPEGVTVVKSPTKPDTVVVAWKPVTEGGSGVEYSVRRLDTNVEVRVDTASVEIAGIMPDQRPCFVVRTITNQGKVSEESTSACL